MTYQEQIIKLRKDLLLSQAELATLMGVSFATVNRWEKGHHEPTIKQKRALKELCRKKKIKWEIE